MTRRTENVVVAVVLLLSLLGVTRAAQATVIYSNPLSIVGGSIGTPILECSLLNAGAKSMTALSPNPIIEIELLDATGSPISVSPTTTCTATLTGGQICDTEALLGITFGYQIVYCRISYTGTLGAARASLRAENAEGETLVAVPVH